MGKRDYYEVLGVGRSASADEIKRAHRKLAKQYHPDRNKGDQTAEAKFKEVQEAYDVLRDQQKRREYDQFGHAGVGHWSQQPHGEQVYSWGGGSQVNVEDLEDLFTAFGGGNRGGASVFSDFFGGGGRGRRQPAAPRRGADLEQRLPLTFEQAIHGTTIELSVRDGDTSKQETLSVRIPPGAADGTRIRLRGKGHPGERGGARGDLYLLCTVQPHRYFERSGDDILIELPVSVSEAVLGAKVDVPTIDGMMTLTIPPGTSGGAKLRLRGKGVRRARSDQRGDQIVIVRVVVPTELSPEQRALFESLADTDTTSPRSEW